MASKPKRPHLSPNVPETPDTSDSDSNNRDDDSDSDSSSVISDGVVEARSSDDDHGDDEGESDVDIEGDHEVVGGVPRPEFTIEFRARTPEISDSTEIARFLNAMFGGSDKVNVSDIAQYIVNQRNVGSVVTQSPVDYSDDEDDGDVDHNQVYAVGSVVKLRRDLALSRGLLEYLVENVKGGENLSKLSQLISGEGHSVGLLISERISNIPPELSVPMYESLFKEIRKAKAKKIPHFDFTHFIIICRVFVSSEADAVYYRNAEEEVIEEVSEVIELEGLPNAKKSLVGINGMSYDSSNRLLVFRADQIEVINRKILEAFPNPT